jgi:hypothetical protein
MRRLQVRDIIPIEIGRLELAHKSARRRFGKRSHFEMALLLDEIAGDRMGFHIGWETLAKRHRSDVPTVRKIIAEMEQRRRVSTSPLSKVPTSKLLNLVLHERVDRSKPVDDDLDVVWSQEAHERAAAAMV